jgi:hypothetical protein
MLHRAALILWTALTLALGLAPAQAQPRVALVIGNSAYQHAPALPNPGNDAADVAAALERLGFSVRRVHDGSFDDMRRALRDFAALAQRSEMALVYFAGHGMEIGGENWLVPVDAELKMDIAADQEAISLRGIFPIVSGASKLGLIILDACRNNPFSARMRRSMPTRAVERGLARVEPTGSVLVAYAAKDGTTAADGTGRNSPFTTALLKHIERPGLEINYLFRNVRQEVMSSTPTRQEPVVYGSLPGAEIYFRPPVVVAPVPTPALDELTWNFLKTTTDVAALRRFVGQFPASARKAEAEQRIAALELEERRRTQQTVRPPEPVVSVPQSAPPPSAPAVATPVLPAAPTGTPTPGHAPATPAECDGAAAHFKSMENVGTAAAYEYHARIYGRCPTAAVANAQIEARRNAEAAVPGASTDECRGADAHFKTMESIGTVAAYDYHARIYGRCPTSVMANLRIEAQRKVEAAMSAPRPHAPAATQQALIGPPAPLAQPAVQPPVDTTPRPAWFSRLSHDHQRQFAAGISFESQRSTYPMLSTWSKSDGPVDPGPQLLSLPALPVDVKSLIGNWRCRILTGGGDWFSCRIVRGHGGIVLHKMTGNNKVGWIETVNDRRLVYFGAESEMKDFPGSYGTKSPTATANFWNDIGYIERVGTNRLRLEYFTGLSSGSQYQVMELSKGR